MLYFFLFSSLIILTNGRSVENGKADKEPITLDEYLNGSFNARTWNGTWIAGDTFIYKNNGDYYKFDLKSKKPEKILEAAILSSYSGASVSFSHDQKLVLIRYNVLSIFRHSIRAQYAVYDIANNATYDLHNQSHLQLATFSPVDNSIAYVFENNIYYLFDFTKNSQQLTSDGVPGIIYCGVPDWVYEEEVFGSGSALWFSPDGENLAYAIFNDTNVHDLLYVLYGEPGSLVDQYPSNALIKYPKVGQNNPVVKVAVQNLKTFNISELELPKEASESINDYILYDLTWITKDEIAMISTNRVQTESKLLRCTIDGSCEVESSYKETGGWVDPIIPNYSKNGKQRLEIQPQVEDDDRYDHILLTDMEKKTTKRLTFGRKVVTTIYGWDEDSGLIFYGGSVVDTPSQQQVFVVSTGGEDKCLTCSFEVRGEACKYADASFSKDLSYIVKICRGPGPNYVEVQNTKAADDIIVWEDNKELMEKLSKKLLPVVKNLKVPLSDKYDARVRLLLPPNLDESAPKKYPAIVKVYAGPNTVIISDQYSAGFENYIVTSREYIQILIDGRGASRDGKNKLFELYRKMGTIEIEDQLTAIKYLQKNVPYIDANNTGIWGWSYGGFASSWALVKDNEHLLKFALSVAPVTNFIYYDTIYTERYMGLPTESDNLAGYNNTDLTRNAESFRGKSYMLMHGNADDNVHYQNSMLLAKALELADIPFRQQSYPDENHSLGHVSRHVYHTIDRFWEENFKRTSNKKQ